MLLSVTNKNGNYVKLTASFNIETGDFGFECRTNVRGERALRTQDFRNVSGMYRELSAEILGERKVA